MEKIYVDNTDILDELEKDSALTWEGLSDSDDNLKAVANWLEENGSPMINEKFYIIKGSLMNKYYNLKGSNRYNKDLTLVSIKLNDLKDVMKIVTKRFEVGGRWFDDIVANNRRRG